jgi:hypothetical protein
MPSPSPDPLATARLRAEDVFGLVAVKGTDSRKDDRKRACERVREVLAWWNEPSAKESDSYMMDIAEEMERRIRKAPLVIAFKANVFYPALVDPHGDYINVFERIERKTDHRDDPSYVLMRAEVENAMFRYATGGGL